LQIKTETPIFSFLKKINRAEEPKMQQQFNKEIKNTKGVQYIPD